jgi:hypothetical protein
MACPSARSIGNFFSIDSTYRAFSGVVAHGAVIWNNSIKKHTNGNQNMNKFTKLAALSLGAAFVSTAAQAQLDTGDLILGFTSQAAGVTSDYVVDLGAFPGEGNTTPLNTIGYSSSTFNTTFGSALDSGTLNVGIVGGVDNANAYIYTSLLDNGTGTALVAGSTAPLNISKGDIGLAAGTLGNLNTGVVDYADGFTANVAENPASAGTAPTSFTGSTGDNPLTTIPAGTSVITLDIYQNSYSGRTSTTGFDYVGDVQLDITDSGLTATFDPVAAPEPSTYALLAGGGLLAFALRRKFRLQNA